MSETTETDDPLAGFAALMGGAAQEAKPVVEHPEAPYGYTTDPDGTTRPKKSPGRPRKSPSLEDLKAQKEARSPAPGEADGPSPGDRAPVAPKGRRRRGARTPDAPREDRPAPPVPQSLRFEGAYAKAINRLYRKAGRFAIALGVEPEGRALIEMTRAEDEDDVTVGDAWEALIRVNPRVKAFWTRMLAGGAVSGVIMAHLPLAMAFLMRENVRTRIPFGRLLGAFAEDTGEGEPAGEASSSNGGGPFAGMTSADMEQMAAMAQAVFGQASERAAAQGPVRGEDGVQRP